MGNARGGRTAAILASLTSTCRRHDVDPQLYFTQLLMNLPQTKMSQLSEWLPDSGSSGMLSGWPNYKPHPLLPRKDAVHVSLTKKFPDAKGIETLSPGTAI